MALGSCPTCGHEISTNCDACPNCGEDKFFRRFEEQVEEVVCNACNGAGKLWRKAYWSAGSQHPCGHGNPSEQVPAHYILCRQCRGNGKLIKYLEKISDLRTDQLVTNQWKWRCLPWKDIEGLQFEV
jgi:hypothetical protein